MVHPIRKVGRTQCPESGEVEDELVPPLADKTKLGSLSAVSRRIKPQGFKGEVEDGYRYLLWQAMELKAVRWGSSGGM